MTSARFSEIHDSILKIKAQYDTNQLDTALDHLKFKATPEERLILDALIVTAHRWGTLTTPFSYFQSNPRGTDMDPSTMGTDIYVRPRYFPAGHDDTPCPVFGCIERASEIDGDILTEDLADALAHLYPADLPLEVRQALQESQPEPPIPNPCPPPGFYPEEAEGGGMDVFEGPVPIPAELSREPGEGSPLPEIEGSIPGLRWSDGGKG